MRLVLPSPVCCRPSATRRASRPMWPPPTLCLVSVGGQSGGLSAAAVLLTAAAILQWPAAPQPGATSSSTVQLLSCTCFRCRLIASHACLASDRSGPALLPHRLDGVAAPAQRGGAAGAAQPRVPHPARAGGPAGHEAVRVDGLDCSATVCLLLWVVWNAAHGSAPKAGKLSELALPTGCCSAAFRQTRAAALACCARRLGV